VLGGESVRRAGPGIDRVEIGVAVVVVAVRFIETLDNDGLAIGRPVPADRSGGEAIHAGADIPVAARELPCGTAIDADDEQVAEARFLEATAVFLVMQRLDDAGRLGPVRRIGGLGHVDRPGNRLGDETGEAERFAVGRPFDVGRGFRQVCELRGALFAFGPPHVDLGAFGLAVVEVRDAGTVG
jgi:hypothetical protein